MSKNRPPQPQQDRSQSRRDDGRPTGFVKVLVSVLLVWHLTAVFLAGLSIPGPSSMLVGRIAQQPPMQWYLDALYLNHGHFFFAPNVGPGHLIRYELVDEQGNVTKGELPDRNKHWPRLWYHRHLMLADQADMPAPDGQQRFLKTYARYLLRIHEDAQSVRLRRIAHYPLDPWDAIDQVLPDGTRIEARTLDDPATYETLVEVVKHRRDLQPSVAEQSQLWQGVAPQTGTRAAPAGDWPGGVR